MQTKIKLPVLGARYRPRGCRNHYNDVQVIAVMLAEPGDTESHYVHYKGISNANDGQGCGSSFRNRYARVFKVMRS